MTIEEYKEWIEILKTVEIQKNNLYLFDNVFKFSPDKFAKSKGLDPNSFVKEFQSDRKILHRRLIDWEKVKKLSKRKVTTHNIRYGNDMYMTRICICKSKFKNEVHRSRGGYEFYENIQYEYVIVRDQFHLRDEVIIIDERERRVYCTVNDFNNHFIDIREHKIDQLLNN